MQDKPRQDAPATLCIRLDHPIAITRPRLRADADLYADGVHLNSEGKYLEAVTHYAVVFQDDPHDCIITELRFWKGPYGVDKAFAEVVWDVVAEVVKVLY